VFDNIAIEGIREKKNLPKIKVAYPNIMTDDIFGKSYAYNEIKSNKSGNV